MDEFIDKTEGLLRLERKAEMEQYEELLLTEMVHNAKSLESKGLCLTKLLVSHHCTGLYGRRIVTFKAGGMKYAKVLPCNRFTTGDIVGVYASNRPVKNDQSGHNVTGTVSHISQHSVSVAIDSHLDHLNFTVYGNHLKLVKLANNVTYRRLNNCLKCLKDASGLPRKLFGEEPLLPVRVTTGEVGDVNCACVGVNFYNSNLNHCQREAVLFALSRRDVAIVHGPPGTGKTTTLIEIILKHVVSGCKVLACAPSNIAVDNMVERLQKQKVKVVRLGHPARLAPSIQNCSLDAILSNTDAGAIVRDVHTEIDQIMTKLQEAQTNRRQMWKELKFLKKELYSREEKAVKDVLTSADVVLSTNVGASLDGPIGCLPQGHFSLVVIDECAQALEVSCWIPLLLANKCVLAGDHKQLPPTIISNEAAKDGLGVSLMERLYKLYGNEITYMLQVQYRMNVVIMECPSKYFYNNGLVAADVVSKHLLSDLSHCDDSPNTTIPLLFIDTCGCDLYELETGDSESKGNEGEADLVFHYVKCLIDAKVDPSEIAVIAPYNLQVELIRQRFHTTYDKVEVKTVDGFQGREKEAVVISLTRSNLKGEVGFLSEQRRSNVAVTRARRHLAIVGDSSTVSHEPFLNDLLNHISTVGEIQSAFDFIHDPEFQQQTYVPVVLKGTKSKSSKQVTSKPTTKQWKPKVLSPTKSPPSIITSEQYCHTTGGTINDDLRSTFTEELLVFVADQDKQTLDYPMTLSSLQRKVLHEVADEMNLQHISHGSGPHRYISISKPLQESNTASLSEESTLESSSDHVPSSRTNLFCQLDNQEVIPVGKVSHKPLGSSRKEKSKSTSKTTTTKENKVVEKDDDEIPDLCIKKNNCCSYSGCKKSIKLLGQTCKFCCKLFCISHHQAEIHGCGEEAKVAARKESLRQFAHPKTLNVTKRAQLHNKLEKNLRDQKSKRQSKH